MRLSLTSDVWWKNAVVYCLDIETYADGDGDGIGDFRGAIQRIDHLDRMGVTCIWLMPFFPTPDRDDGYDITDFYSVDPRLGTLGDFAEFMRVAGDRGIRVIADLVVNHTSDEHPWFREARSSRDSGYRDWYIWSDRPEPDDPGGIVFPDQETSLWEYDETTDQYYFHRFYRFQPDLNTANPAVRDEIARILGFWMELGLSGFRVDAVPYLLEQVVEHDEDKLPDPHEFFNCLRAFLSRRDGSAALLGEVNLPYDDLVKYFGNDLGNEITMCFDFIGMQRMYLSLARGDARPLADALLERPRPPKDCQWATFVRNHDELTLDKLSDSEREEVFAAFGPEENMRLFGRGLRRRLPTMLGGDMDRIKMVYSLLFSLPGTPVLFYGEEIGMGENLELDGRQAVRTPMQWAPGRNGGFSEADPAKVGGVVRGEYGPERVNVSAQHRDPGSLLAWITRLIRNYRDTPELAWGDCTVLRPSVLRPSVLRPSVPEPAGPEPGAESVPAHRADPVLAHRIDCDGDTVLAVHNFSDVPTEVELTLDGLGSSKVLTDLLVDGTAEISDEGRTRFKLGRYGCRWFRATIPETAPAGSGDEPRAR